MCAVPAASTVRSFSMTIARFQPDVVSMNGVQIAVGAADIHDAIRDHRRRQHRDRWS
jgi:hypothetical protein